MAAKKVIANRVIAMTDIREKLETRTTDHLQWSMKIKMMLPTISEKFVPIRRQFHDIKMTFILQLYGIFLQRNCRIEPFCLRLDFKSV
jgi:hypothetical protein